MRFYRHYNNRRDNKSALPLNFSDFQHAGLLRTGTVIVPVGVKSASIWAQKGSREGQDACGLALSGFNQAVGGAKGTAGVNIDGEN
jgi:hypothetical protein